MSINDSPAPPFHVTIAGGGIAALEAALALRQLGDDRFRITMIAPDPEFVYRPMTVREPFAHGPALRYPIAELAAEIDAELIVDRLARVDATARVVHTHDGLRLGYDALVLGLGARPQARYERAVTVDSSRLDDLLHGLIQDVEGGYVHDLAFVVPAGPAWPLPIYELALMTARRAFEMNVRLAVRVLTPEPAPLASFGDDASTAVAGLLADAGITTICSTACEVPDSRHVVVDPGGHRLAVDRVIALPELFGPAIDGLPVGERGFIPTDPHCRVSGLDDVYAAGDATDHPLKYGGIAAQQADTAALAIASSAGLPVEAAPLHPSLHGVLLTGADPLYLTARIIGGRGFGRASSQPPTDPPPAKISARYLAPYLAERDRLAGATA